MSTRKKYIKCIFYSSWTCFDIQYTVSTNDNTQSSHFLTYNMALPISSGITSQSRGNFIIASRANEASREVSNLRDSDLHFSNRSDIWQAALSR